MGRKIQLLWGRSQLWTFVKSSELKQDQHWSNPVAKANFSPLSSAKVYSNSLQGINIDFVYEVKNIQRHFSSAYLTT